MLSPITIRRLLENAVLWGSRAGRAISLDLVASAKRDYTLCETVGLQW
jgi:hypothetical protein